MGCGIPIDGPAAGLETLFNLCPVAAEPGKSLNIQVKVNAKRIGGGSSVAN
jgi:hypothetical protein